ncbi:MAG: M20/M25/M40 family metallo-hydrolase, partial [Clostridia bacterium]|nr:M20/M25/M40 family metallo-hydrolase [Clostridia bacterium]
EALGWVTAGCAGGIRSDLVLRAKTELFSGEALSVSVTGLMGGHSGENINSGRANANKLMGRLLDALLRELPDTRLVTLTGGSKDNAIPRECRAWLAVSSVEAASSILEEEGMRVAEALSADDRGFSLTVESGEPAAVMLSGEDTRRAVSLLHTARNGVMAMSEDIPGLVETSRNLGVVTAEDATLTFVFSSRSSKENALDGSVEELEALASSLGCTARHYSRYPGWEYAKVSPLRDAYLRAFRDVTGRDAAVNVIHAGLECGIICSKLPDMDVISIGPSMHDIHSPDEALELSSTETFCQTLMRLMEIL